MAIKTLWVIFAGLVFLSATVCVVWGQSSSLGVKAGDTFVYSYGRTWQSNQTGVEPPSSIGGQADLQFIATAIMSVDGASVTANTSYCFSTGIYMEVATSEYGGGYVPFYIPPDLGVGDIVPSTNMESGPVAACYINETTNQTFGNQTRTAGHLQIEFPVEGFVNVSCNAYWDQATGVMTQVTYSYSNQTGDTATNWSVDVKLFETSLFAISDSQSPLPSPSPSPSIPEFSYVTVVIIVILATVVIIVGLKRKVSSF